MVNLYEKLGISYAANNNEILNAMKHAASKQSMTLEEIQKCREWLLNPEIRAKYDAKLKVEQPDFIEKSLQMDAEKRQKIIENEEKIKKAHRNETSEKIATGIQVVANVAGVVATKTHEKIEKRKKYRNSDEFKQNKDLAFLNKKNQIYCHGCGYIGRPSYQGHGIVTLILFCCGIIPGILYASWRKSRQICPKCKSLHLVYTTNPKFQQEYLQKYNEKACPECGEKILKTAKKCKHCGSVIDN